MYKKYINFMKEGYTDIRNCPGFIEAFYNPPRGRNPGHFIEDVIVEKSNLEERRVILKGSFYKCTKDSLYYNDSAKEVDKLKHIVRRNLLQIVKETDDAITCAKKVCEMFIDKYSYELKGRHQSMHQLDNKGFAVCNAMARLYFYYMVEAKEMFNLNMEPGVFYVKVNGEEHISTYIDFGDKRTIIEVTWAVGNKSMMFFGISDDDYSTFGEVEYPNGQSIGAVRLENTVPTDLASRRAPTNEKYNPSGLQRARTQVSQFLDNTLDRILPANTYSMEVGEDGQVVRQGLRVDGDNVRVVGKSSITQLSEELKELLGVDLAGGMVVLIIDKVYIDSNGEEYGGGDMIVYIRKPIPEDKDLTSQEVSEDKEDEEKDLASVDEETEVIEDYDKTREESEEEKDLTSADEGEPNPEEEEDISDDEGGPNPEEEEDISDNKGEPNPEEISNNKGEPNPEEIEVREEDMQSDFSETSMFDDYSKEVSKQDERG